MTYAFRPNAIIEIAGQSLSAAESGLHELTVTLGLGCHGRAEMTFWPSSKFANATEGEPVEISIGPEGDEVAVLTGQVLARSQTTDRLVIEALDASGPLSRARSAITFEDSSIADIVERIAGESEVSANADGSDTLSIYYVVPQRPLWDHLRELARLSDRDLSVDADGVLLFQPDGQGDSHNLRYGAELMGWSVSKADAPLPATFAAHGTAGESGNWHWVGTDPLGEDPGLARIFGAFADRSVADVASEASSTAAARAMIHGCVLVTGNPAIRPADSATLEGLPGGDPDPLRVRGVTHRMDGATGFVTCLEIEGGGAGGGLLGGLL
ncbi:MAG: hypothetical protein AAGF13_07105 [Pseudomonadota bacterium]